MNTYLITSIVAASQKPRSRHSNFVRRFWWPVRFLGILISLMLVLPAVVQAQFFYTTNSDDTITITGYIGPGGAVSIPSSINNLPVIQIGDYAFMASQVTSVKIPSGVVGIGSWAFQDCTSMSTVTIPDTLTQIGQGGFFNCGNLGSFRIPEGVTNIGGAAFGQCFNLTSVTIPKNVTSIGGRCFSGCINLASIDVNALNSVYSSVNGVLFNKSQATLLVCPEAKAETTRSPTVFL